MLSIIVPVYNVSPFLDECLSSIDAQSFNDYEVIVVNDGSTDNSLEICHKYAKSNPHYKLYSKENGGLMSTWMFAIEKSSGDYFGFVDSDDYISNFMFKEMYTIAKETSCDIVMCDRFDVKDDNITTVTTDFLKNGLYTENQMKVIYENILPQFYQKHISNARWNKIFKRDVFMENIKYCSHLSRLCEDRFITPPCFFSAKSFFYLKKPLYYYRRRKTSNSNLPNLELQSKLSLLYSTHKKMLYDKGLEKYESLVDKSNLNWLYLLLNRNFFGKPYSTKQILNAQKILNDQAYQYCVKKYSSSLSGKIGILIKLFFYTRCTRLFVFICSLIKEKY